MPTKDEVMKWWNGVQQALDDANADIDLSKKEDLLRIRVVDFPAIRTEDNSFCNADAICHLAFVDDKKFDYAQASQEEIISRQNPSPSYEQIEELYNTAKEGRLFFSSLPERNIQSRQLIVNKEGNPEIRPDIDHATKEMDICMDCIREPDKPKKSDYTESLWTRFLAFFGNKEAKRKVAMKETMYETAVSTYETRIADWNASQEMDPEFVKQNQHLALAHFNYFAVACDEETIMREKQLAEFGYKAHKDSAYNELIAAAEQASEISGGELSSLLSGEPGMTPDKQNLIADIMYNQSIKEKISTDYQNYALTEANIALHKKQLKVGSPEHNRGRALFADSPSFKAITQSMTEEEVKAFVTNPENAAKKLQNSLSTEIKKAGASKVSSAPTIPKQNTKEEIKSTKSFIPG